MDGSKSTANIYAYLFSESLDQRIIATYSRSFRNETMKESNKVIELLTVYYILFRILFPVIPIDRW